MNGFAWGRVLTRQEIDELFLRNKAEYHLKTTLLPEDVFEIMKIIKGNKNIKWTSVENNKPTPFVFGFRWNSLLNSAELTHIMNKLNAAEKKEFTPEEVYEIICFLKRHKKISAI